MPLPPNEESIDSMALRLWAAIPASDRISMVGEAAFTEGVRHATYAILDAVADAYDEGATRTGAAFKPYEPLKDNPYRNGQRGL